jgi:hypothetical protein
VHLLNGWHKKLLKIHNINLCKTPKRVGRVVASKKWNFKLAQLNRLDDDKDFIQWSSRCGQEILEILLTLQQPFQQPTQYEIACVVDVSYDVQKPEEEHHRNWFSQNAFIKVSISARQWMNDTTLSVNSHQKLRNGNTW